MAHLIDRDALVAEIDERIKTWKEYYDEMYDAGCHELASGAYLRMCELKDLKKFLDTLEVTDPYEQCIQYPSVKDGIEAHAETYSFNIESELFNQLTKEQQALWRKEIEQACISGGYAGYGLAKDLRYKENLEVKEVDSEKEADEAWNYIFSELGWDENTRMTITHKEFMALTKHFFELGLKAKQG